MTQFKKRASFESCLVLIKTSLQWNIHRHAHFWSKDLLIKDLLLQTPWELAFILHDVKEQPGIWSDLFNAAVIELIPKRKGVTCLIIRGLTPSSSYSLPR